MFAECDCKSETAISLSRTHLCSSAQIVRFLFVCLLACLLG